MTDYTLTSPAFPNGTSVSVYLERDAPPGVTPASAAIDTDTVASGSVTFNGLAEGETYAALATVSGKVRRATFRVPGGGVTMGYVNHGAAASTGRPAAWAAVLWVGSVEPSNAIDGDVWISTA